MANLTLAFDDDLLRRARVRAAQEGISVNAFLRDVLARYATDDQADAVEALIAGSSDSRNEDPLRPWSREELYAERDRKLIG